MIYIVEDDSTIRELIVYTLNARGLDAVGFGDSKEFWKELDAKKPDLIILDIMLPGESGLDILSRLRGISGTKNLPIMMLTAKGSEYDKVVGLDAGADDYMAKPFGMMEFLSRVNALLRRSSAEGGSSEAETVTCGCISIVPAKRIATADGAEIELTYKEYELLSTLIRNEGIVLTRDKLLEKIWGYEFAGESRTVDVHIRTLRKKLGNCGDQIKTVRGVGYKILGGS